MVNSKIFWYNFLNLFCIALFNWTVMLLNYHYYLCCKGQMEITLNGMLSKTCPVDCKVKKRKQGTDFN